MLTANQQAAKNFLSADTHNFTFNDDTQTVKHFYDTGNDSTCIAAMNDKPLGAALLKTVAVAAASSQAVRNAISQGEEFLSMSDGVTNKLMFLINGDPVQFSGGTEDKPSAGDRVSALLHDSYPDCEAKFNALKSRAGSVWENITGIDSAQFSADDMAAIRAS